MPSEIEKKDQSFYAVNSCAEDVAHDFLRLKSLNSLLKGSTEESAIRPHGKVFHMGLLRGPMVKSEQETIEWWETVVGPLIKRYKKRLKTKIGLIRASRSGDESMTYDEQAAFQQDLDYLRYHSSLKWHEVGKRLGITTRTLTNWLKVDSAPRDRRTFWAVWDLRKELMKVASQEKYEESLDDIRSKKEKTERAIQKEEFRRYLQLILQKWGPKELYDYLTDACGLPVSSVRIIHFWKTGSVPSSDKVIEEVIKKGKEMKDELGKEHGGDRTLKRRTGK